MSQYTAYRWNASPIHIMHHDRLDGTLDRLVYREPIKVVHSLKIKPATNLATFRMKNIDLSHH